MVHLTLDRFEDVYRQIKVDAGKGSCTVLIFVANDADALCACKILLSLLKADCIPHEVYPVSGYADLSHANAELIENNNELRSIVMLNCGGLVDLSEYFTLSDEMTCYVLDSHRPLNLHNIYATNQIVVLDDGDIESTSDIKEAFEALEFSDFEEEMEEGEDEQDSEDDGDDAEMKGDDEGVDENEEDKEAEDKDEEEEDEKSEREEHDNDEVEEGDEDKATTKKRKKSREGDADHAFAKRRKRTEKRRRKRYHQQVISEYYSEGTFFGMSTAGMIVRMSSQLGLTTNDFVWMGIVGLTDQYINDHVTRTYYQKEFAYFKEQVSLQANNNIENVMDDSMDGGPPEDDRKGPRSASDFSITCEEREFRLMLFRHWSLWEGMYYSSYVAATLGIWKEKGRQRLTHLLAQMGVPQIEYTQPYLDMSLPFKKDLRDKLESKAPMYGLTDLCYPSFRRQFGFRCAVASADVAYAISALLDGGLPWLKKIGKKESSAAFMTTSSFGKKKVEGCEVGLLGSLAHSHETGVGTGLKLGSAGLKIKTDDYGEWNDEAESLKRSVEEEEDDEEAVKAREEKERGLWRANFYIALDALDRADLLRHGIHLAMHFQSAVVRIGTSILDNHMIKKLKNFQLVVLGGSHGGVGVGSGRDHHYGVGGTGGMVSSDEYKLFGTSVAHLNRLALFLMSAMKHFKRSTAPLVLAALHENGESYLVVGISSISSSNKRNAFGLAFTATAQDTGARCKSDNFDTSVMDIRKEDLGSFMERLQATLVEFGDGD